jgi:hypothetical protein
MNVNSQKIIIVASSKITSAFEDIMEIEEEKLYKGTLKKKIKEFHEWYDGFSAATIGLFYQDPNNIKFFEKVISMFDKYDQYYDVGSEKCTRMALAYGKLQSAAEDFIKIPMKDIDEHAYGLMVAAEIKKLVKQGFWKQFTSMEDAAGANINALVDSLNSVGQDVYLFNTEESVSS